MCGSASALPNFQRETSSPLPPSPLGPAGGRDGRACSGDSARPVPQALSLGAHLLLPGLSVCPRHPAQPTGPTPPCLAPGGLTWRVRRSILCRLGGREVQSMA